MNLVLKAFRLCKSVTGEKAQGALTTCILQTGCFAILPVFAAFLQPATSAGKWVGGSQAATPHCSVDPVHCAQPAHYPERPKI